MQGFYSCPGRWRPAFFVGDKGAFVVGTILLGTGRTAGMLLARKAVREAVVERVVLISEAAPRLIKLRMGKSCERSRVAWRNG